MERKIGEIFKYNGEWYQCLKSNGTCADCAGFTKYYDFCYGFDGCTGRIFKKIHETGKPFSDYCPDGRIIYFQRYECYQEPIIEGDIIWHRVDPTLVDIEIKQNKENNMEEKEITYEELLHYYHSTVGLWAIDRNPQEVHFDWVCKNAFQLGTDKTLSNLFKIGKSLKPFDLEAAKAGKPVCTKDGRNVRIICFDCKDEAFPIVALVSGSYEKEEVISYDKDGFSTTRESKDILFMLPERKEGWVNVYDSTPIYDTKERAELGALTVIKRIATVKIEWEE